MFLLLAIASAQELEQDEAERLARLFYSLTGRPTPEAFLEDDLLALQETRRSPEELEQAVRWIALNVPEARSYTLAGILDSHLAVALGEEEELVLPEEAPESTALGTVTREPRFEPEPLFKKQILGSFYTGTGRKPPDPPTAEDLEAFDLLAWNHWNSDGMLRLAEWVPEHVSGAEELSWAEVAKVAVEKGYNGGPRPDGQLEELVGVPAYLGTAKQSWVVERDPQRFDGGGLVSTVTMGTLPTWLDQSPARLPGRPLRVGEGSFGLHGGALRLGQASEGMAFTAEALLLTSVPGSLDSHRRGLDGGPTWQLGGPLESTATGGHLALATRQGFLGIGGRAFGFHAGEYGLGGVALSMDEDLGRVSVLEDLGLSWRREMVGEQHVQGQTLHGELSPWIDLSPQWSVWGRARVGWTTGGLVEDAGPIGDDVYVRWRVYGATGLVLQVPGFRFGALIEAGWDRWSVAWRDDSLILDRDHLETGESQRFSAAVGGEAEIPWREDWYLSAGARGLAGSDQGAEWGVGTRTLVLDRAWLGLGVRGGRGLHAEVDVSVPF